LERFSMSRVEHALIPFEYLDPVPPRMTARFLGSKLAQHFAL